MFHEGDLQSGIGLAIENGLSVACFVRDDSEESTIWEQTWLQDEEVRQLLSDKAVVLRLQEGSQEAGFLSAFCPLKDVPALVIIHNGQLIEHIAIPIQQDQFKSRLSKAFGSQDFSHTQPIPNVNAGQNSTSETPPVSTQSSSTNSGTRTAQSINEERIARLQQEHRQKQENIRREQESKARAEAKGKQKAEPSKTDKAHEEARKIQRAAAEEARKQKEQRQRDLDRVKERIEADKRERQAHLREVQKEREEANKISSSSSPRPSVPRVRSAKGKNVQLQVRLFDGSTKRSSFPSDATLTSAVRPWIDAEMEGSKPPYTFRHIQAPLPSRELSMSDEANSLADLDLFPSATLALVPVSGYSNAYEAVANSGPVATVQRATGGIFGLVGSVMGAVGDAVGRLAGYGDEDTQRQTQSGPQSGTQASASSREQGSASQSGGIKIRTLADQRREAKDDTQLYNGNQLNFQPRDDDKK